MPVKAGSGERCWRVHLRSSRRWLHTAMLVLLGLVIWLLSAPPLHAELTQAHFDRIACIARVAPR